MRCKVGDLAFIVGAKTWPETNGWIVRVVRRAIPGESVRLSNGSMCKVREESTTAWWIEREGKLLPFMTRLNGVPTIHHVTERVINDDYLRPIRNEPGEDETLTWAPSPTATKEFT